MLNDISQRQQALDVTRSFLIQAPAGSGKTELLIQRYLKLLSQTVTNPEEIIAITFTRKAANEMRARVIASLEFALSNNIPIDQHQKQTWELAKQVVQKDEQLNWHILQNPSRLRILTIDSFSAKLTRQMPILSQFGAQPEIDETIAQLFQTASDSVLNNLEQPLPWNDALETLLRYLDNDAAKVRRLFISMLHNRDQWLPYVLEKNPRTHLENALGNLVESQLEKLAKFLQCNSGDELLRLLNFAASNMLKLNDAHPLCHYLTAETFFPATREYLIKWQTIANLLLTDAGEWRSRFTKKEGFPAAADAKNSEEKANYQQAKDSMLQLIEAWSDNSTNISLFKILKMLPEIYYSDEQWEVLSALVHLLPVLVAELYILFKQTGTVDYTEMALRALQALGQPDDPTDLALALDYKIKHILVDEFQDTSVNQFRLLELLTRGWEFNDGRTLFLVGDPMQSIYRFRKAEVGLFIKARDYGINQIQLEFLQLSANFRSANTLVEWNNKIYNKIFPENDDLAMSAVRFSNSHAARDFNEIIQVQLHPSFSETRSEEAINTIKIIKDIYNKNSTAKIAILVLARTHLTEILLALKTHCIAYRAIELEKLYQNIVIQDLLSLTKALLNLGDIISWYAILRAPWAGLSLADLLVIKTHCASGVLLTTLEKFAILQLSEQGKNRLEKLVPILKHAWLSLKDFELSYVVESVWLAIGAPLCVSKADQINIKRFFDCLEKFEKDRDILDVDILETMLQQLTAESPTPDGTFVEVMTIHKSKGLEFDAVLIPGLDKSTKGDEHQLLVWQEIPSAKNATELLLAPIKSTKKDSIYDYILYLEKEKSKHELNRLLYVATTRAKYQLHLLFNLEVDNHNHDKIKFPQTGSLLAQLWPAIAEEIRVDHASNKVQSLITAPLRTQSMQRIPKNWQHPLVDSTENNLFRNLNSSVVNRRYANWQFEYEKQLGIVFHKVIECMPDIKQAKQKDYVVKILKQFNLPLEFIVPIQNTIEVALQTMVNDPFGQWILSQRGFSEFSLYHWEESKSKKYIIDKLFIADGFLWIIDFKTAAPKEMATDAFLVMQKKHYKQQLMQYKQAANHTFDLPIRMGLYFPLIPAWVEYE